MHSERDVSDMRYQLTADDIDQCVADARQVSTKAYAPYSQFNVGAVVISTSGRRYAGCNVENASYGLACCAERNAIFQMVSHGETQIECIVIFTPTNTPTAPCGACRQVINEFGTNVRIVSTCDNPQRMDTSLEQLLPNAFGPHNLK